MDEFERRSRLVSLAYEVLRDMKSPSDEATVEVILSDLSRACLDKAATLPSLEGGPPLEGGPQKGSRKLMTAWPSILRGSRGSGPANR
jgi:hypothetical protein